MAFLYSIGLEKIMDGISRRSASGALGACVFSVLVVVSIASTSQASELLRTPVPSGAPEEVSDELLMPQAELVGEAAARQAPAAASPAARSAVPAPTRAQPRSDALARLFGPTGRELHARNLYSAPNMFGDFMLGGGYVSGGGGSMMGFASFSQVGLPPIPITGRMSVADNNKPLSQDRAYFRYNHFENVFHSAAFGSAGGTGQYLDRVYSIDTYTFGLEKTFREGLWSVEMRLPLAGETEFSVPAFGFSSGQWGNLGLIFKRMLYETDRTAVAAGLGIDLPTGSELEMHLANTEFRWGNQAVHLVPYLGFVQTPNDRLFYQGFAQVDVPTNGQSVWYDTDVGSGRFGVLTEQTLLHLDVGAGVWLYRNPMARLLTGLAPVLELHYTSTLNDEDSGFSGSVMTPTQGWGLAVSPGPNRLDVLDLSIGIHAELAGDTLLRVGGVLPVRTWDDRTFDSEVQVQLERRF